MKYNKERALELLRIGSGVPTATFRPSQEDAIAHIVEGRKGRLLVVQKTGWGKSFVYFIATKLLREGSFGPTLLISPLLSLMRDQQEAAERMGLVAWTANSSNKEDWPAIAESIKKGRIDVLMFHPKQLVSETFMRDILVPIAGNVAFLVVDEAHCISDWGHDFVPEYKIVSRTAQSLPANLRLLATTATANVRVMEDLETILGPDLVIKRGELGRPSITLQTITMKGEAERLAWLAEQLEIIPGSGIIYALTKAHVKRIVDWLQYCNIDVEAYTSDSDARPELERKLRENKLKALVATSALGMGYDKPDLTFVIHYQAPGSVVAYYQQVGRAGRAIDDAYGVILGINKEADVNKFFIDGAFPKKDEVKQVLEALNENEFGLTEREFSPCVNMSSGRINKTLLALSLESPSPIVFEDKKWQLTNSILSQTFWDTADRITQLRREELKQMREYMALDKGHMKFLVAALDGDVDGIGEPRMPNLRKSPSAERTQAATEFMRRSSLPITARAQWPAGGLPKFGVKGKISLDFRADEGRSLSMWGDAGWGEIVRVARYENKYFSDELVTACETLIRLWKPQPFPTWVTCIPSLRHPDLVPDFAKRIADVLGIPFHAALKKVSETKEKKGMANSSQQATNIDGALIFVDFPGKCGPVLLVDDIINSGWTFTVGAWLLRRNGCGNVFPLALAKTGNEE